ncbi:MAG TPA: efflux RND transporter periplasmic adaptor subunit [Pseudolabrys sp.]|nr:efflux RND transporter periplasmic adaptor subunit [Pseudolabrys sp.]
MSKKYFSIATLMLVAFVLASCGKTPDRQLQGWVEAETVFVSPDEQGRVEVLKVRQGDKVEKGDLLFTLDDDLQKADVAVRQATVTNMEQSFDRAQELLKTATGTQKAFEDAQAALRQAKANLDASQTRLARRRALSPAAGSIEEVYFRPGETVPPGRPVVALLPPSNLKIRFFAPETELAKIKIGEAVTVTCDACAVGLKAKVTFIARSAEYTPPVIYSLEERAKLVYLIEAFPDQPEKFRVGQPVSVSLPANEAAK